MCVFDVSDASRWKAMSHDAIRSMCDVSASLDWPTFPPLSVSPLDSAAVSNQLEHELRSLVTQHRRVCPAALLALSLSVCLSVCLFVYKSYSRYSKKQ